MNKTLIAALVAASQLFLAKPAHAILFNFSWRSDAPGLSVIASQPTDPVHEATGTVEINRAPGQSFNVGNILNLDITVTDGPNIMRFNNTIPNTTIFWDGNIDANGMSASTNYFQVNSQENTGSFLTLTHLPTPKKTSETPSN